MAAAAPPPEPLTDLQRCKKLESWKAALPLAYDQVVQAALASPSYTVDWLPVWLDDTGEDDGEADGWGLQRLVLAQDALGSDSPSFTPHCIMLLDLVLIRDASEKPQSFRGKLVEEYKLEHAPGPVHRARHCPASPHLVATMTRGVGLHLANLGHQQTSDDGGEEEEEREDLEPAVVARLSHIVAPAGNGLAWSPSTPGALLATGEDGGINLIQADLLTPGGGMREDRGRKVPHLGDVHLYGGGATAHPRGVMDAAWTPEDGPGAPHTFASVGAGGELVCWDRRASHPAVASCSAHVGAANALACGVGSPHTIVTGGADGRLCVLDVRCMANSPCGSEVRSRPAWAPKCHLHTIFTSHKSEVLQMVASPCRPGLLAVTDAAARVMVWDLAAAQPNGYLTPAQRRFIHWGHAAPVADVCWCPNADGLPSLASVSGAWSPADHEEDEPFQHNVVQVWSPGSHVL